MGAVQVGDRAAKFATCYATAADLTPEALLRIWRSLSADRRDAIGTQVLLMVLADTVANDDGLVTTPADREAACGPSQDGLQDLYAVIEAALPQVLHWYPAGYRYEAHDRHGELVGTVETVKGGHDCAVLDTHQFRPTSRGRPLGPKVEGELVACLPEWVRRIVADGGWFGAMLPDGRRYPDEFCPITDDKATGVGGLSPAVDDLPSVSSWLMSTALEKINERA